MKVFERCEELNLPPAEFIVEGSGVLDALGIRESRDLDVVVEQSTFEKLERRGFSQRTKDDNPYLETGEIEVWLSFDDMNFAELMAEAVQIRGYNFTSLELIKNWKLKRGLEKDKRDLQLIQQYLRKIT
jgi:hypothetical protein